MLSKVVFFVGLAVTVLAVPVWLEVDFGLDTNGYQLPLSDSDDVAAPDQGFCGPFEQGTYNITVIEERPGHKQHVTAPKANAWLNEGPAHKNGHWKIIPQENAAYAIENVGLSRGQREPFFAELKKAEGLAPPPPHPHHRWAVKAAHRAPQGPTHWRIQKAERGGCTIHHATEPCVWGPVKHFAEGGHHIACKPGSAPGGGQRYRITRDREHGLDEPDFDESSDGELDNDYEEDFEVAEVGFLTALRLRILESIVKQMERLGAF